jgi:hypothetical protein
MAVPAGRASGEPAYVVELSNACACGSTVGRDMTPQHLTALLDKGRAELVSGALIARRVRKVAA